MQTINPGDVLKRKAQFRLISDYLSFETDPYVKYDVGDEITVERTEGDGKVKDTNGFTHDLKFLK